MTEFEATILFLENWEFYPYDKCVFENERITEHLHNKLEEMLVEGAKNHTRRDDIIKSWILQMDDTNVKIYRNYVVRMIEQAYGVRVG